MTGRLLAAAAAAALLATGAPAGTAAQSEDDGAAHLVVVRQTPWVPPGGTFAIRLRIDDAPPDAQLRVSVHDRVRTRSAFARSLDGLGLRARLGERRVANVDELAVLPEDAVEWRIPTGPVTGEEPLVDLGRDEEGVYPVVIELLDGDGEVADRVVTHLLRLPDPDDDEHPLATVVLLPLHAPPSHVGPAEVDATALAPLDVTVDALRTHPGVPLTLLPTPEALAGAATVDPAARARLAAAAEGRDVLARTWVRLREAAWDEAGLDEQLDAQRRAGRAAVTDVLGRAPSDEVAVIDSGGGVDAVAHAVDAGADTVIVPQADLEPLDEDVFPVTLTLPFLVPTEEGDDPDTVTALAVDAALAAHVGATDDPVLDAHHLLADLAVLALDAPVSRRVAVVALDDDAATDAAFLDAFLAGLSQPERVGAAPFLAPSTVDDALAGVELAGADGGADPDDPLVRLFADDLDRPTNLGSLRADLEAAAVDLASYRSVFGPDDALAAEVDELILTAASSSFDAGGRRALLDIGRQRLRAELGAIHPPPRQRVTLTAREGQVQLALTNDADRPADVTLELEGDRLEFPDHPDGRLLVRLGVGTTRVDLDVRARSSGDAPLDLRVTTPDGRLELGRSRVTVRTTAVSGVGLVLMGAALAFLVVWWTRTILRERGTARRRHPAHARG